MVKTSGTWAFVHMIMLLLKRKGITISKQEDYDMLYDINLKNIIVDTEH